MVCSYCEGSNRITGEHLIPQGLLDLFAECEYNVHMMNADNEEDKLKVFKGDRVVINDVCDRCNNNDLSTLDSYGISLINEHFLRDYTKDDEVSVELDYDLFSRWILKLVYNNTRAFKQEYSDWFRNKKKYILSNEKDEEMKFSIFSGLAVNTSPIPDFFMDNLKLLILFDPLLVKGSLLVPTDGGISPNFKVNTQTERLPIENIEFTALLRFGSLLIYTIFWKDDADVSYINNIEKIISQLYPYTIVNSNDNLLNAVRATHAYNFHHPYIVDSNVGMSFADRTNSYLPSNISPVKVQKSLEGDWPQIILQMREQKRLKRKRKKRKKK